VREVVGHPFWLNRQGERIFPCGDKHAHKLELALRATPPHTGTLATTAQPVLAIPMRRMPLARASLSSASRRSMHFEAARLMSTSLQRKCESEPENLPNDPFHAAQFGGGKPPESTAQTRFGDGMQVRTVHIRLGVLRKSSFLSDRNVGRLRPLRSGYQRDSDRREGSDEAVRRENDHRVGSSTRNGT